MKKKIGLLITSILILSLTIVGCSSTDPSLKNLYLDNLSTAQKAVESKHVFKFKTNLNQVVSKTREISKEENFLYNVLGAGVTVDYKQTADKTKYLKISPNNPDFLRTEGYWKYIEDPFFEAYVNKFTIMGRTSTEEKYLKFNFLDYYNGKNGINDPVATFTGANFERYTDEFNNDYQAFIKTTFEDYINSFEYDLRDIKYLGKKIIETPSGEEELNHIRLKLNSDDIKKFLSYLLGDLAEYDKLDVVVRNYFNFLANQHPVAKYSDEELKELGFTEEEIAASKAELAEFKISEEEIQKITGELSNILMEIKMGLDSYSKREFSMNFGYKPELIITYDIYATDSAQIGKINTNIRLDLSPVEIPEGITFLEELNNEPVYFEILQESFYWNYNDVAIELPDKEQAIDIINFTKNLEEIEKINDNSFIKDKIKEYLVDQKIGQLQVGSNKAYIKGEKVILNATPYYDEEEIYVPIRTISEIANADLKWYEETREIKYKTDYDSITLQLDNNMAIVEDWEIKEVPVNIVFKDGQTYIPLSFIEENLWVDIEHIPDTNIIIIQFY